MGLLDGLLGQVLGGMAGSGRAATGGGSLSDLLGSLNAGSMPGSGEGRGPGVSAGAALPTLVMLALSMLQRNGGIEGVLDRLRQAGHGAEADSWVSTGRNLPIDPSSLGNAFGQDEIERMARGSGLTPQQASGGLAALFPEIIDRMTPQGRVETGSDDVVQQALEMLKQKQRPG